MNTVVNAAGAATSSGVGTRVAILAGFVVVMFLVAGAAILIARRRHSRKNARALAGDIGMGKGTRMGSDVTHSESWLAEATAEDASSGPKQSWAAAFLGPEHLAPAPELTGDLAPPPAPQPPAPAAAPAPAPVQEPVVTAPVVTAPAPVPMPEPVPATLAPRGPVVSAEVPERPPLEAPEAPYRGKRAAATVPDAPSAAPATAPARRGFLVENHLDDD